MLFPFLCLSLVTQVLARPWEVTALYEQAVYTNELLLSSTFTEIVPISPTAISLPEAISTITTVSPDPYDYDEVTIVQKLYPSGVGELANPDDTYNLRFKVNLIYTAPAGCSSQWTSTVAAEVSPPQAARELLPKPSVTTSLSVDNIHPFQPATHTYTVVFVDPTQLPSYTLENLHYNNRPTALYTDSDCAYTTTTTTSYAPTPTPPWLLPGYYTFNSYTDSSAYYNAHNPSTDPETPWIFDKTLLGIAITPLGLILALTIGWIGLFLLLGFLEAWIRFRRLMTGWQTRRGLPICWSLTVLPVSLLLLFWFKKGYRARSTPDSEILQRRWREMGAGTKLRLFFVWGFRFAYPPMLGPAPARVKTSKQPGKNPGPRLLEPTPPRSPEVGRDHPEGEVTGSSSPEMVEGANADVPGAVPVEQGGRVQ
ncbi:hypothetical protein FE257_005165 [Aspergillus nanangensis]|uniref:Uncharacterized protein n=1 Tax=Aspergillus nanangensis TaxID=2582783 RepID=A0AAD4GMX8_ASPNN|nr:hypothetical protein FE257_005165 [Aspergillus nanangensis]